MKVYFWRSANERILQCRRGKNIYRPLDIPANVDVAEYNPLTNSVMELVDQGMVIGIADIGTAIGPKIMLQSTDNLEKLVESENDSENQLEEENVESSSEKPVDDEVSDESPPEGEDTMFGVGDENVDNARTLSGSVEVQISPVAERDDGLNNSGEYRSKVSPDGLYSDDDGMDTAQDRSGEAVNPVSSSDESPSSD